MDLNRSKRRQSKRQAALVGLGFDHHDGQKRITRGPNFVLAGGSEETHGRMQETAIKVNEQLQRKGKQLGEVSLAELRDMVAEAHS